MNDQQRLGPSLIESIWRYRAIVVGITLLFGVAGYFLASQEEPSYDASALLFLQNPASTPGLEQVEGVDPEEYVPQQAARARSRTVLSAAQEGLTAPPPLSEMAKIVAVEPNIGEFSLTVRASAPSAEGAAELANAVANAYMAVNEEAELERAQTAVFEQTEQIERLEGELASLEQRFADEPQNLALQSQIQTLSSRIVELELFVSQIRSDAILRGSGISQFEPADPPAVPARPRPALTAISLAFIGALGAALWAYWWAEKSQRVLVRTDPQDVLDVPLLGEIPLYRISASDPLASLLQVDPAAAEAYEFVLSSIEFALSEFGGSTLLVTSTLPGDGKTTTALQLAIAASRDRRRVVLVDADVRARGLTGVLGAQDRSGLSDLISMDLDTSDVIRRYRFSEQSTIPVVTAGQRRGDPAALLRTNSFRQVIGKLKAEAELLVIDASPLLAVADASIVAGSADGMVIVVSHGTPVSELQKVRERLKFVSTPLLGYIFNRSDATTAAAYGYGYGLEEDSDGVERLLPKAVRRR